MLRPARVGGFAVAIIALAGVFLLGSSVAGEVTQDKTIDTRVEASAQIIEPSPVTEVTEEVLPTIQIQNTIDEFVNSHSAEFGVVYFDLNSGEIASFNPESTFNSASLYKLFMASEILKLVDTNQMSLDQIVDFERSLSIETCLDIMITVSDNDCGVIFQKLTGAANSVLPQLTEQGFSNTDLRGYFPQTTAQDVAKWYQNLLYRSYLSEQSSSLLLDMLSRQRIADRIPKYLPQNVEVAHKTADLELVRHDAGIIFGASRDFVLVVMSDDWEDVSIATDSIAHLAKAVYDLADQ